MRYGIEVAAFFCIIFFPNMISCFRVASPSFRRIQSSSSVLSSRLLKNDFQRSTSLSHSKLFATIPNKKDEEVKPTGLKSKISELWSMYGFVAVGTYGAIYVSTLASIFISMDYDLFNAATFGFDPIGAVKKVSNNTQIPFMHSSCHLSVTALNEC
jgi:hypothetical protein